MITRKAKCGCSYQKEIWILPFNLPSQLDCEFVFKKCDKHNKLSTKDFENISEEQHVFFCANFCICGKKVLYKAFL
jgi:hypothetical protein